MGDHSSTFDQEVAAVRHALSSGLRLIDTADMYGNGGAEKVVGAALKGSPANHTFIVSKVLPSNAHYDDVISACERSLRRLGRDYIDLYLLHWRRAAPFQETLDSFETLKASNKIRHFGVSNFDATEIDDGARVRVAMRWQQTRFFII